MGSAGNVIIYVLMIAATAIISFWVLAYAAHCFLTVVQDTAAGIDKIVWPKDLVRDWIRESAYVWGLLLIWLAPAGILMRALRQDFLPDDPARRFLILAVPGLWLFLPVGLMSALSSADRWVPFRLTMVRQFLRIFPATFLFYVCTAALGLATFVPWLYALSRRGALFLPLAGAISGAALLIYARLLGRMGWLIGRLKQPVKPARADKRKPPKVRRDRKSIHKAVRAHDPWAVPKGELPDPEPNLPVEGYGMAEEAPKPRKKAKQSQAEEPPAKPLPVSGYGLSSEGPPPRPTETPLDGSEPVGLPPADRTLAADAARLGGSVSDFEKRLAQPPAPPYVPSSPLFTGVYTFPWYGTNLPVWVLLSLGFLVVGACVHFLMQPSF